MLPLINTPTGSTQIINKKNASPTRASHSLSRKSCDKFQTTNLFNRLLRNYNNHLSLIQDSLEEVSYPSAFAFHIVSKVSIPRIAITNIVI